MRANDQQSSPFTDAEVEDLLKRIEDLEPEAFWDVDAVAREAELLERAVGLADAFPAVLRQARADRQARIRAPKYLPSVVRGEPVTPPPRLESRPQVKTSDLVVNWNGTREIEFGEDTDKIPSLALAEPFPTTPPPETHDIWARPPTRRRPRPPKAKPTVGRSVRALFLSTVAFVVLLAALDPGSIYQALTDLVAVVS